MQRLSIEIVERMFKSKLTRCEIDFLIAISRYQNESGEIKGVYYKEIAQEMGFSIPQFYAAKKALEQKGFIKCEKNNYYDHDITIIDNDYLDIHKNAKDNLSQKPYIKTNHKIFYSEKFQKLKPGAKLLTMIFISYTKKTGKYKVGVKKFFDNFKAILGVKERILRVYLTQLKEFFSIGIKSGQYRVRIKVDYDGQEGKAEIHNVREHWFKKTCRRNRIKIENDIHVEEVRKLIRQYYKFAEWNGEDIVNVIDEGIVRSVDPLEDMSTTKRVLNFKLVHLWVRKLLDIESISKEEKAQIEANTASQEQKKASNKNKFHNFTQRKYDMGKLEKALFSAN